MSLRPALAIALDVSDLNEALRLAEEVHPWCDVAKVGLQLFTSAGPPAVEALVETGYKVFLDLKLHDIPNTVAGAARAAGRLGASLLTVHAAGGEQMLRAGVDGFAEGRSAAGLAPRQAVGMLAVTVLTSEPDPSAGLVAERCKLALVSGCAGVVCAAAEIGTARSVLPEEGIVLVPGIRSAGQANDDQVRVATAGVAARAGASILVVGRAVTNAADPAQAAAALAAEVEEAVSG